MYDTSPTDSDIIFKGKLEAIPDGQIRPPRWWQLDSYHRNFRGFNLFGRLYLKVGGRLFSRLKPAWIFSLFKPYDPVLQYHYSSDETAHVRDLPGHPYPTSAIHHSNLAELSGALC